MVSYVVPKPCGPLSNVNYDYQLPEKQKYNIAKSGYLSLGGDGGANTKVIYTIPARRAFYLETASISLVNTQADGGINVSGDCYITIDNFGDLLKIHVHRGQSGQMTISFPRPMRFEAGTRFSLKNGNNADPGNDESMSITGYEVDV